MVGRTVGHYRVLEKLGEGGMGEVYLAEDSKLERRVALKVLPSELASDSRFLDRFEREARAVAALNHPGIVSIFSIESAAVETGGSGDGELHFLTMELVEGESLDKAITDGGLSLDRFFDLAIPLADALAEAHDQGIVHRDLKPANIMVDRKGRPKILDFGLAKLRRTVPAELASEAPTEVMTEPGLVMGTYPYMSPEQAEGREADHRSDLFSFGIVLYEMATGERPFQGDSPVSLISSILKDEPRPVFEVRSDLPEGLDAILARCLEKDPDQRYSSASELQNDLGELRDALESGTAPAVSLEVRLPAFVTEAEIEGPEPAVFVGRDEELAGLDRHLGKALAGEGRMIFITGEAGTGKTALARAFVHQAQEEYSELVVAAGVCSAHTGPGDAYAPIHQVLGQLTGDVESLLRAGALSRDQTTRLWSLLPAAASSVVESASDLVETLLPGAGLLHRAEAAAPRRAAWLPPLEQLVNRKLALPPDVMLQQGAVFGQCTRLLQDLAATAPILLILEDLHWSDAGSADLLCHLARQLSGHPILVVGSYRPSEVTVGRGEEHHPLEALIHEVSRAGNDREIHLSQETETSFVDQLIDAEPNALGREFRDRLCERTQGHAMFTVELLRDMQERGMLVQDPEGVWVEGADLDWQKLPAQVEGVISERIGRLSEDLRELLQVACVEGESFTAEVLARIRKADTRATVRVLSQELERRHRLVGAEGLSRINGNRLSLYRFLHVLFQKYLYDELDEAERAYLHEDVGNALEELFGERAEEISAQLARHFEVAGNVEKALGYRVGAAQRASRLTANHEAVEHYRRALDLLATLPASPARDEQELQLQVAICSPLLMAGGWASSDLHRASARALELAESFGDKPEILPALTHLSWHYSSAGDFAEGIRLSEKILAIARENRDELQEAMAGWSLGLNRALCGDFEVGRDHLERAEAYCDAQDVSWAAPVFGLDPGVAVKAHLSWLLTYLGYLQQGRDKGEEAIARARGLGHPHSLCFALGVVTIAEMRRGDWQSLTTHATEALGMATEHGFPFFVVFDLMVLGLAMAVAGSADEGIGRLEQAIDGLKAMGSKLNLPVALEGLAAARVAAGDWRGAHETLDEAVRVARDTGELKVAILEPAFRGLYLEAEGDHAAAEEQLLKGMETARECAAKLFELRCATALARIWQSQGKAADARSILAPIYDWFTEGFDEAPLVEARSVLEELD